MNVRVDLNYPIYDGAEIVFKAPCGAADVTGLVVYYPSDSGIVSSGFAFADAHTNDLGHIDELFAEGAAVKVILDTETSMAFVQNAATNAYLEGKFASLGGTTSTNLCYASLSAAIADINNGTTKNAITGNTGKVEVFAVESGEKYVRLLADEDVKTRIDINKDIILVLNGHTLNLTTPTAYLNFAKGTNCIINGEVAGSEIFCGREDIPVEASATVNMITADGNLRVLGGTYSLYGSFAGVTMVFRSTATSAIFAFNGVNISATNTSASSTKPAMCIQTQSAKAIINNCQLTATAKTIAYAIRSVGSNVEMESTSITATASADPTNASTAAIAGMTTSGTAILKNSTVFADAQDARSDRDVSIGITNTGTLVCMDMTVTGTHSAVENKGNLYVRGGEFRGYAHGGFYLAHNSSHDAYINNAVIEVGVERSKLDFLFTKDNGEESNPLAGFYLKNEQSQGACAYIDGCTITGKANELFAVNPCSTDHTNTVYISNTTNNAAATTIRVGQKAEAKIGMGCNFTVTQNVKEDNQQWAEETGKLYRRMKEDMPMDGRDFNALLAYQDK